VCSSRALPPAGGDLTRSAGMRIHISPPRSGCVDMDASVVLTNGYQPGILAPIRRACLAVWWGTSQEVSSRSVACLRRAAISKHRQLNSASSLAPRTAPPPGRDAATVPVADTQAIGRLTVIREHMQFHVFLNHAYACTRILIEKQKEPST
jgi:hypothetical protein